MRYTHSPVMEFANQVQVSESSACLHPPFLICATRMPSGVDVKLWRSQCQRHPLLVTKMFCKSNYNDQPISWQPRSRLASSLEWNSNTHPEKGWGAVVRKSKHWEGIVVEIRMASSTWGHLCSQERFTTPLERTNHTFPRWTAVKLYLYFWLNSLVCTS